MGIETLRKQLKELKSAHQVAGLKTGTEIEDMGEAEIALLKKVSRGIVPLIVKIGGPEARQDMRMCLRNEVDVILGPMIETVYALSNFVSTAREIMEEVGATALLAMNLESETACGNLNDMIASRHFDMLSRVTIGRGDLSRSMHLSVDDEAVLELSAQAVRKIKNENKLTSTGGGLKPSTAERAARKIQSDFLNSRHILFRVNSTFLARAPICIQKGLEYEIELYRFLLKQFPERKPFYRKRIETIQSRMMPMSLIQREAGPRHRK